MHRGYVKIWRKEVDSDIWKMGPIYLRVWSCLLLKAQWFPVVFPTRKKIGIHLNPGQILTSLDQISEWVKWYEWGVEKKPNKKTIKEILGWLEGNGMVTVESNAKGTFISIANWAIYQPDGVDKSNAKGTDGSNDYWTHLKKVKEVKEIKEEKKNNKKKKLNGKKPHGEFQNVFLKPEEVEKLYSRFGKNVVVKKLESMSRYFASKGDKYKSHYATFLNWADSDGMPEISNVKQEEIKNEIAEIKDVAPR